MNSEIGRFDRCVKHPSQFITGFCLTCLVERLSNFDSVESIGNSSCGVRDEVLEISESVCDSERKNDGVRVRKTLLSLFQLDDLNDLEKMENDSARQNLCYGESSEIVQPVLDNEVRFDGEKSEFYDDESLSDRRISLWLHSKILMKGLKWRSRSTSKKGGIEDRYLENKCKLGISCNWMDYADSSNVCWEKPRNSWDGSLMSKALSCSFSCLEERQDGSDKIKESLPDEAAASDIQRSFGENYVGKVKNGILADHNSFPLDGNVGDFPKQACKDIAFSDGCRKKPNGWSRVWDWSISSPFRDFGKKNGPVLERSLSESWRDNNHRDRNRSCGDSNGDIVAASVNRNGQKSDLQKMREFKLSRSHSVRYSSPRNIENGLLRFYLTPLRTSRRNRAKCNRKTSQFFR